MLRIVAVSVVCFILTDCYKIHKKWVDLENAIFTFNCTNRAIGFYADVEYNCQIFHMCDLEKRRIPHVCPNSTSFNQEYRVCDWENTFDCSDAPKWYFLNERTYATDPPKNVEKDYIGNNYNKNL